MVEAPLEEPFLGYYRASARMWNQLRREFLYAAEQVSHHVHAPTLGNLVSMNACLYNYTALPSNTL